MWEHPELSGEFEVAPDGSLKHALYNRIKVGGLPVASLPARLSEFLGQFQRNPQIQVEPLLRVNVTGEVRAPRIYQLPPETTIADAVAMAGGSTERGRLDRILLTSDDGEHALDPSDPRSPARVRTIRSGDQIAVPPRRNVLRDYVGPLASVTASIASIITLSRRH